MSLRKRNKVLRVLNYSFYDVPCPLNLNYFWTLGSTIGLFFIVQVVSGFLLSCHYIPSSDLAFDCVQSIRRDVKSGWALHNIHATGASFMMGLIYLHTARGLYYGSYLRLRGVWYSGIVLMLMTMASAFFGYVLPWGQMSYWGATVITKLFEVIPFVGSYIVELLWGDFVVSGHTLNRFYSIHFILPFSMIPVIILHLYLLHEKGSSNTLGTDSSLSLIPFYPYYALMDLVAWWSWFLVFSFFAFGNPKILSNPQNLEKANPLKTPVHIEPEWYFLPFYAILRSIPHKGLGIFTMVFSFFILVLLPVTHKAWMQGVQSYGFRMIFIRVLFVNWLALGWIGTCPAEEPYIFLGRVHTAVHFLYFIIDKLLIMSLEHSSWAVVKENVAKAVYEVFNPEPIDPEDKSIFDDEEYEFVSIWQHLKSEDLNYFYVKNLPHLTYKMKWFFIKVTAVDLSPSFIVCKEGVGKPKHEDFLWKYDKGQLESEGQWCHCEGLEPEMWAIARDGDGSGYELWTFYGGYKKDYVISSQVFGPKPGYRVWESGFTFGSVGADKVFIFPGGVRSSGLSS